MYTKSIVLALFLSGSGAHKLRQKQATPTKVFVSDTGIPHLSGAAYNPGASTMDPNALVWQRAAIHDGKVHGEKEHQENANDLQAYGEQQETVANTRIPYASTFVQLNTPTAYASDDQKLPHIDGGGAYNPGASSMDPNGSVWQRAAIHDGKVHGEKQHQENANDLQAYGEQQETVANTRIPYASTFVQLNTPTAYASDDQKLPHIDAGGNYNPGASTMDPNGSVWQRATIHDGKVHGEKQHQENANDLQAYGEQQETVANTRIPYASTFVQLNTPTKYASDDQKLPHIDGGGAYNPGASSMDPNGSVWQRATIHDGKVHGEKQHQENANDLQAYGEQQETVANTRIPYASTLLQTDAPGAIFVDPDTGIPHLAGPLYNPGASSMDPNALVWQRAAIHDGKVHGEKEHQENANDLQAYGEQQETVANTRLPYASTFVQTGEMGGPTIPSAPFVSDTGIPHIKGADYNPGASTMDPNGSVWQRAAIHDGKVHGEKEHQENANDLQAYGEQQETVANTRIPYASTFVQLNTPTAYASDDQKLPHIDGGGAYNPGASSMDPNGSVWQRAAIHDGKVHGEKQHQENANDLQAYGEQQETVANTRIPYASTFVQTNELGAPSIPSAPFVSDTGIPHIKGAAYNPGASSMDPNGSVWQRAAIHDGKVHGEKEHQENANDLQAYGEQQETVANTRIPYASTLVQTNDIPIGTGDAGETYTALGQVPLNYQFIKTGDEFYVDDDFQENEDPETIEIATDVPHDFRFVHISNSEGELMKMRNDPINLIETMPAGKVPLSFDFVHIQNKDGDDVMRWI